MHFVSNRPTPGLQWLTINNLLCGPDGNEKKNQLAIHKLPVKFKVCKSRGCWGRRQQVNVAVWCVLCYCVLCDVCCVTVCCVMCSVLLCAVILGTVFNYNWHIHFTHGMFVFWWRNEIGQKIVMLKKSATNNEYYIIFNKHIALYTVLWWSGQSTVRCTPSSGVVNNSSERRTWCIRSRLCAIKWVQTGL